MICTRWFLGDSGLLILTWFSAFDPVSSYDVNFNAQVILDRSFNP